MAHHKSAKKRARQDVVRRARNRHLRATVRNAIRAVRAQAAEGGESASEAFRSAERLIRKAASRGVLSKKQASRKVSRLAQSLNRAAGPS